MSKRELRPKATESLSISPAFATTRNCHAVVGLEPSEFRSIVRERGIAHTQRGHLLIVELAVFVEGMRAAPAKKETSAVEEPESGVGSVLKRLGRRKAS